MLVWPLNEESRGNRDTKGDIGIPKGVHTQPLHRRQERAAEEERVRRCVRIESVVHPIQNWKRPDEHKHEHVRAKAAGEGG